MMGLAQKLSPHQPLMVVLMEDFEASCEPTRGLQSYSYRTASTPPPNGNGTAEYEVSLPKIQGRVMQSALGAYPFFLPLTPAGWSVLVIVPGTCVDERELFLVEMASDPVRWRCPLALSACSGVVQYRYRYRQMEAVTCESFMRRRWMESLCHLEPYTASLTGVPVTQTPAMWWPATPFLTRAGGRSIWQIGQVGDKFGLDSWSQDGL
ncbi:hypothetical protein B0T11DRAFT_285527 [Plectosphaerella cucumerina]|uniref:Uncharacterized protein n=1 Tax=Plectosphaerella cucumerina TaxID=40658 RepID=A0A8K0X3P0_9PEZI|nr:hypothetical protein B0T11DRAFT_285527 [Plectosphaerella cucumerina]